MNGQSWGRVQYDPIKDLAHGVQQMLHLIAQKQFARVGNRLAAWNKAKIPIHSVLNNRVFIDFTPQILSKSGAARRTEGLMESGGAQIGVNQQDAAIMLTDDRLSQIRRNEGLAFRWNTAGDEQFLQLLGSRDLVQARAQGAKAFCADAIAVIAHENAISRIQCPPGMATPFDELLIIEEARFLESRIDTLRTQVFDAHHVFGRLNVTIDLS